MGRYAVIEGGTVANVIVADSADAVPGATLVEAPPEVAIGDTFDGTTFTRPAPAVVVPESVTRRQARQALLLAGLLDSVQPAIDAIPDPIERGLVQIDWDDSQEFERHRPTLLMLASALGLTEEQVDTLFIAAAGR